MQGEKISMATDRLKHSHLVLMVGISLCIPLFLAYSLYVDLSGTVLASSDMSFEDPRDKELSTSQNQVKVFVPAVSSHPLPFWTHSGRQYTPLSSPLTSHAQISPVLRC
jgi:hypothetical protein